MDIRSNKHNEEDRDLRTAEEQTPTPVNDLEEVGRKLKACRKMRHLTQEKLAEKMESTQNDVYRHEKGKREMGIRTFIKYAEVLQVYPQELLPDRITQKK